MFLAAVQSGVFIVYLLARGILQRLYLASGAPFFTLVRVQGYGRWAFMRGLVAQ